MCIHELCSVFCNIYCIGVCVKLILVKSCPKTVFFKLKRHFWGWISTFVSESIIKSYFTRVMAVHQILES